MPRNVNRTIEQMEQLKLKATLKDEDLERQVLSTLCGTRGSYEMVSEYLDEECFDDLHSRNIFNAIKRICDAGDVPELPFVLREVQKTDKTLEPADFSLRCMRSRVTDIVSAAKILCDYKVRRTLYYKGLELTSMAGDTSQDSIELASRISEDISGLTISTNGHAISGGEVQNELVKRLYERRVNPNMDMGILTGFNFVDSAKGLHPGSLIVIAGTTASGKTSLTLAVVDRAIKNGAVAAMYSLEMSRQEVQYKIMSMNTDIKLSDLMYTQLTDSELFRVDNFNRQTNEIYSKRLFYDDRFTSNIELIIDDITRKVKKLGVNLVVIDYVQIASSGANSKSNDSTEKELADIARKLRNLANKLRICIIVLSQLHRDKLDPIPSKSRLRGSGQIEEAATDIWLLFRPDAEEKKVPYPAPYENEPTYGTAMVIVDKCRFGARDKYLVRFIGETTCFTPL